MLLVAIRDQELEFDVKTKNGSVWISPHWFLLMLLSIFLSGNHPYGSAVVDADTIDVGVILNLDSTHGLVTNASIAMGHRDFYASPSSSTAHAHTIVLHVRNSRSSQLEAASAGKFIHIKSQLDRCQSLLSFNIVVYCSP